jgi:glycosyltransferase involved in cell wall biosynthesis
MLLKALERECSKRCALTIVQDEERARLFGADNHIPQERILCVPIAGLRPPYKKKSDYLRIHLGIPPEKRIILYAGNIADWSMSYEIAEAAQTWANDLVLVLHTYMTGEDQEPYIARLMPLTKTKKVYLSLNPVRWEVLPELLASADIGLAFYKNLGKNFYHISGASNKLVQYSQVGLPVITSDFPDLVAAVEGNNWGKCAEKPAEIERLANEIFADYECYRNSAYDCYKKYYSIENYFSPVIDTIKSFA